MHCVKCFDEHWWTSTTYYYIILWTLMYQVQLPRCWQWDYCVAAEWGDARAAACQPQGAPTQPGPLPKMAAPQGSQRKGGQTPHSRGQWEERCEERPWTDGKERGEGAARVVLAVKISLQLVQRPCWSRYSCCSHEEPHTGADECTVNVAAVHGKDSCGSKGESMKREVLLWTDHNPYCPWPYISQSRGGRGVGDDMSESEPEKRHSTGGRCFRFPLCFSSSKSLLTAHK